MTFSVVRRLILESEPACVYCGEPGIQVDHIDPRANRGTDDMHNLVPCCASCNTSKGSKTLDEWMEWHIREMESSLARLSRLRGRISRIARVQVQVEERLRGDSPS